MRCRYIPPPDEKAREAIFEVYLKKYGVSGGVDVRVLSEMTEGYSGADIENVCRESVYGCLREKSECVEVSVESLMKAVKASKPSLGREAVLKYEAFEKAFFVSCVVCCHMGVVVSVLGCAKQYLTQSLILSLLFITADSQHIQHHLHLLLSEEMRQPQHPNIFKRIPQSWKTQNSCC